MRKSEGKKFKFQYLRSFYLSSFFIVLLTGSCLLFIAGFQNLNAQTLNFSPESEASKPVQTKRIRKKKKRRQAKTLEQNKLIVKGGIWGAIGVNLTINETGAVIEYDCADAEITGKFMINENGEFSLPGTFTMQTGGAASLNEPPKTRPARFEGKISDDNLTLKVTLTDNSEKLEEVILKRGTQGKIRRCY
jgi:hypothetical protein